MTRKSSFISKFVSIFLFLQFFLCQSPHLSKLTVFSIILSTKKRQEKVSHSSLSFLSSFLFLSSISSFKKVYGEIKEAAAQEATRTLYEQGYNRYRNGDYQTAIEVLEKAYEIADSKVAIVVLFNSN